VEVGGGERGRHPVFRVEGVIIPILGNPAGAGVGQGSSGKGADSLEKKIRVELYW